MKNTGPTTAVRDAVYDREQGRCARCGRSDGPFQIHHRSARRAGGSKQPAKNQPGNLVLLDQECHADIESHRTRSYVVGWLVREGHVAADTPLLYRPGRWVLLDDDGGITDVLGVAS